ncbi:reticulon-4-like isoform X2 [Polyodon spathula]|uniref:reticulon-4-like isoform X2 n=1 Tax=Polyodon spathula TaxID=7913 RepID=UPI001B7E03C6|nr:reticulon-4-like isoform X2 [Polyodon spathula]
MEDQISSTTPSADDLSKREQEYMDESLDLMENNEAEPRPADPVNQSVTPVSFSNPEPFAIPEKTPTASTGKPTETEQHQGEKKQTKTQEIPEKSEKTTPVEEEKREAPKPESPAVSSSSSSGFSNETIFPSAPSEPLMQSFAESFVDMQEQPRSTWPLDQKDDSSVLVEAVAPVSSLSPLPSPDSLEELSLSESCDQAPASDKVQETHACLLQTVEDSPSKVSNAMPLAEDVKAVESKMESEFSDTKLSLVGEAVEQTLKTEEDTKVEKAVDSNTGTLRDVLQTTTTFPLEPNQIVGAQQEHFPEIGLLKHVDLQMVSELKEQTSPVPEKPEVDRKDGSETDKIAGIALGSPDTIKTELCEVGGFEFSADQVGHLVGSQKNERSHDELDFTLVKDSKYHAPQPLDTSSGSSSEQSPLTPEVQSIVTTQPYVTFATFEPTAAFDSPQPDFLDARKAERSVQPESFLDFQPVSAASTGLPQVLDSVSEENTIKVSESPTPDLVQGAFDNELQDVSQIKHSDETNVDLVQRTFESIQEPLVCQSGSPKELEGTPLPPSLPDILESPLSSGKVAAGSSEGTQDSELSPVQVTFESVKPLAFVSDSQISAKQETVSFKEVKTATPAFDDAHKRLGECDLVKEAQTTSDLTAQLDNEESQISSLSMSRGSSGLLESIKESPSFEQMIELSTSPSEFKESIKQIHEMKEPLQESPAFEAVGESIKVTDPVNFVMESECKPPKELEKAPTEDTCAFPVREAHLEKPVETVELEGSIDYSVATEEFEIIEAMSNEPLSRGVIDEFLETLDNSKVSTVSELGMEHEMPSKFDPDDLATELEEQTEFAQVHVSSQQSSFTLSSEPTPKATSLKIDLGLENQITCPDTLREAKFQEMVTEAALSVTQVPNIHSTSEKAEKPVPPPKADEDQPPSDTGRPEASKTDQTPNLSTKAVVDLLYWRDIKKTGVVFGASLFLLLSLTVCSIVSVFSYLALALLSVSITFRIYKGILQAVQKSDEGHPFKAYLDSDVAVSEEVVHKYSDAALGHINCALKELRHLFLVEDLVDSLKFAVLMWILTYVGALFNGLTLLILALISLFSIPVIYERHQAQIDHYLALVNNQVKDIVAKIQAKVPGLKRKSE